MKPANYGPFYAAGLYPKIAEVFRAHGYALAVHGSLANDFDLIAVPWVDNASDPQAVADECNARFAATFSKAEAEPKPHGRVAYKLALSFADCALDVSFTPMASGAMVRALAELIDAIEQADNPYDMGLSANDAKVAAAKELLHTWQRKSS